MQVMLTNEPALVAGAASLLEEALRDNKPALATLYQTGVFYFALAYCGSNFTEIARLFHVSHCSPCTGFHHKLCLQWQRATTHGSALQPSD